MARGIRRSDPPQDRPSPTPTPPPRKIEEPVSFGFTWSWVVFVWVEVRESCAQFSAWLLDRLYGYLCGQTCRAIVGTLGWLRYLGHWYGSLSLWRHCGWPDTCSPLSSSPCGPCSRGWELRCCIWLAPLRPSLPGEPPGNPWFQSHGMGPMKGPQQTNTTWSQKSKDVAPTEPPWIS